MSNIIHNKQYLHVQKFSIKNTNITVIRQWISVHYILYLSVFYHSFHLRGGAGGPRYFFYKYQHYILAIKR